MRLTSLLPHLDLLDEVGAVAAEGGVGVDGAEAALALPQTAEAVHAQLAEEAREVGVLEVRRQHQPRQSVPVRDLKAP